MTTVGCDTDAEFLLAEEGGRPLGICLLTRSVVKRGPFPVRTLWFGTAGEPEVDSVYVEFSDVLCLPGRETDYAAAIKTHIDRIPWDEFVLPRMNPSMALDALRGRFDKCDVIVDNLPSRFLDLDSFRNPDVAFEETLPRKLRQQIRQSFRIYEEEGPVTLRMAASAEEGIKMLDELAELHEASWQARGLARGAFGSDKFRQFHQQMIRRTHGSGGVQVAKIAAGERTIGLIYNLVSKGCAYFYQSGLAHHANNRVKPGFICQVLCVNASRDAGLRVYDFMGGDTPYKKELGKDYRDLITITVRRRSLKMKGIECLVTLRRRVRDRRKPAMDTALVAPEQEPQRDR
ncbi:MAG: GNAT family N-acetyltransferase [Bryobacterales bacterium]|nr:GNAT family N-acetyltransferase [Bryobacterales bacterium]